MSVEYDPAKAAANLKKHGVSFDDAEAVLFDPLGPTIQDASAEGDERFVTVGLGSSGSLLVVVHAERKGGHRIISARRATARERKAYET